MSIAENVTPGWTAVDLVDRFGAIPLARVMVDPLPGTATVDDVVRYESREGVLCELFDGTLVRKTVGAYESYLASLIAFALQSYLREHPLGVALTADGMVQIAPNQVRIPDACFIAWNRLEGSGFPERPAPCVAPNLVVEIVSRGNTVRELDRKCAEYFAAGVDEAWLVYPELKQVRQMRSMDQQRVWTVGETLVSELALPGFSLDLTRFFAPPQP